MNVNIKPPSYLYSPSHDLFRHADQDENLETLAKFSENADKEEVLLRSEKGKFEIYNSNSSVKDSNHTLTFKHLIVSISTMIETYEIADIQLVKVLKAIVIFGKKTQIVSIDLANIFESQNVKRSDILETTNMLAALEESEQAKKKKIKNPTQSTKKITKPDLASIFKIFSYKKSSKKQ